MTITVGDAALWLRARDDKLDGDLRQAEGKTRAWVGRVGGFMGQALSFAVGGVLQQGLGRVSAAVGGLVEGMIGGNAAFEQYNTQFAVLLGSTEAAKDRLAELADFGQKTPFDLPEVVKADTILQGFGLHSAAAAQQFGWAGEQIRTIAGDVASGTGADFQEMALLIGKFSAGATGEAIARMAELGITNRAELRGLGLQFDKAGTLLSPLPKAMNVVLGLMQKKYGGLMAAQSKTFKGMLSNLQDWAGNAARTLGAPIFDRLKDGLGRLLALLGAPAAQDVLRRTADLLGAGLSRALGWTETALGRLRQGFVTHWPAIRGAVETAWGRLSTIFGAARDWLDTTLGPALGRLRAQFDAHWPAIRAAVSDAAGVVDEKLARLRDWFTVHLGPALGRLRAQFDAHWPAIRAAATAALQAVNAQLGDLVTYLQERAPQGAQTLADALDRQAIPALGRLADTLRTRTAPAGQALLGGWWDELLLTAPHLNQLLGEAGRLLGHLGQVLGTVAGLLGLTRGQTDGLNVSWEGFIGLYRNNLSWIFEQVRWYLDLWTQLFHNLNVIFDRFRTNVTHWQLPAWLREALTWLGGNGGGPGNRFGPLTGPAGGPAGSLTGGPATPQPRATVTPAVTPAALAAALRGSGLAGGPPDGGLTGGRPISIQVTVGPGAITTRGGPEPVGLGERLGAAVAEALATVAQAEWRTPLTAPTGLPGNP